MKPRSRTTTIAILFATVFIDLIGVSIVIPVAAPLFLSTNSTFFDASLSVQARTVILSLLLGVAPLVQFFTAPLWGAFSDRYGRKKVLTTSVLVSGLGHALFALAVVFEQPLLLFPSRMLAGAGAGNVSAANSSIADISKDDRSKSRNFGLIGTAVGLGIIFGPLIGGILSNPSIVHWFGYATPLWFAAILSLINSFFLRLVFQETLTERLQHGMNVFTGLRNLRRAFQNPNLRVLYAVSFLSSFGFNLFVQFFSVFLVARFGFGTSQVGSLVAYLGLWLAFTQGIAVQFLSRIVPSHKIVRWAMPISVVTLLVLAGVNHVYTIFWLLPLVALSYGVNPPNLTTLVSKASDRHAQGEALGISESMSALSFGLPPFLAATVIAFSVALPMVLAAVFIALAWFIFSHYYRPQEHTLFHEI